MPVARGTVSRVLIGAPEHDLPAATDQAQGQSCGGYPSANQMDGGLWLGAGAYKPGVSDTGLWPALIPNADQHLPFLAVAFDFLHDKTGGLESTADKTGTGEGGECGAGPGQTRQPGEQVVTPHLRILARRKAIEEPGIDEAAAWRMPELIQRLLHIAKPEIKHHASFFQQQPMAALCGIGVVGNQLLAQAFQLRPVV